jgi:hypothetical protein
LWPKFRIPEKNRRDQPVLGWPSEAEEEAEEEAARKKKRDINNLLSSYLI